MTNELIAEAQRLEAEALANAGDLTSLVEELTQLTRRIERQSEPQQ